MLLHSTILTCLLYLTLADALDRRWCVQLHASLCPHCRQGTSIMNYIRWIPSPDSCEGFGICQILLNAGDLHAWWTLTRYDGWKRGLAEQDQCYAEAVEFAITLTKFSHVYVALCGFLMLYAHLPHCEAGRHSRPRIPLRPALVRSIWGSA